MAAPHAKGIRQYIWPAVLSVAGLTASTYGANALSDINLIWGYIAFLTSGSIFIGYWIRNVEGRFWGRRRFITLMRKLTSLMMSETMPEVEPQHRIQASLRPTKSQIVSSGFVSMFPFQFSLLSI